MTNKRRMYRVGEKLQAIIAKELLRVGDPRFSMVTISSVVMSSDLRYASVYWVVAGGNERVVEVEEAFEGARGRFRKIVGSKLGIRFVPELKF
ncbi:MAG: 30S ribosome-binding factor RbfA, partial [SAR324 cluster bacterium]|nr:30S ribosome-binding factor RbfA [SAR324 cluster bacterium]